MTKATEQDLIALFTHAPADQTELVDNGAQKMPLHIIVMDGNDDIISEFDLHRDSTGYATTRSLFRPKSLESFVFPITYTAVDSNGKEWELVLSEEIANELRRRH